MHVGVRNRILGNMLKTQGKTCASDSFAAAQDVRFRSWRPQMNTAFKYAKGGAAGSVPISANSDPLPQFLSVEQARAFALETGFAEAGLLALPYDAEERDSERFEAWVSAGRAGSMRYLERRAENGQLVRSRVQLPFPWARSALVCFAGYSGSPIAIHRKLDAEGLFSQEKATLHAAEQCTCIGEPL
jgi:hypothetical protein